MQDMEKSAGGILDVNVRWGWGTDATPPAALSAGKQSDHTFDMIMKGHEDFPEERILAFVGHRVMMHDRPGHRLGPV